jgi:hypothetical protein
MYSLGAPLVSAGTSIFPLSRPGTGISTQYLLDHGYGRLLRLDPPVLVPPPELDPGLQEGCQSAGDCLRGAAFKRGRLATVPAGRAVGQPPRGYIRGAVKGSWDLDPDPRVRAILAHGRGDSRQSYRCRVLLG